MWTSIIPHLGWGLAEVEIVGLWGLIQAMDVDGHNPTLEKYHNILLIVPTAFDRTSEWVC